MPTKYHDHRSAICDGCRYFLDDCLTCCLRDTKRGHGGRRLGVFSASTVVLCGECRSDSKWRYRIKVASEHRRKDGALRIFKSS